MNRGELYRVKDPRGDPKNFRVFLVVSRQLFLRSSHSSAVCAPVFTDYSGLPTQVPIGPEVGLKHHSSVHCDAVTSIPRSSLTNYVGSLPPAKMREVDRALAVALGLDDLY